MASKNPDVASNQILDYGLYVCVVTCMIDAKVLPVTFCGSSPSHVERQQNQESARMCVLSRSDVPSVGCICIV